MRVRRTAESPVVVLAPVQEVVLRLVPRPRPVRHLVVRQSGGAEQLVGDLVLVGLIVVIGVPIGLGGERRSGLHGEPVRRDMGRVERDHLVDGRRPVVDALAGRAVDHVEVERRHTGFADRRNGTRHVVAVVGPTERQQHVRRHRLDPHAHPIHPARSVGVQHLDRHVVGVALDRDLGIRSEAGSTRSPRPDVRAERGSACHHRRTPCSPPTSHPRPHGRSRSGPRRGTPRPDGRDRSTSQRRSSRTSTRRTGRADTPRTARLQSPGQPNGGSRLPTRTADRLVRTTISVH